MVVIATGFIPLSQLSIVSMNMLESSQWLGKITWDVLVKNTQGKPWGGALAAVILKKSVKYNQSTSKSTTLMKRPWENTVRKVENAGNHEFHLSKQCFLLYQKEKSSSYQLGCKCFQFDLVQKVVAQ